MRTGQNPAKNGLQAYHPARLGVILLTYVPIQSGYFAQALEIFKIQVASLHKNTMEDFDLLVFDNGSCQAVQSELQKMQTEGLIDWLTLSRHNIGKTGALNWGIRALPNELVCYSDGDVYFRPGWLENSLNILNAFPQVGMVTAQPCYFDSLAGTGRAHLSLTEIPQIEVSTQKADPATTEEYVRSIGDNPELQSRYRDHVWQTARERGTGAKAVIGASHFQFLADRSRFERILPLPSIHGLNREDDYQIIARLDQIGLLQLSTEKSFVYHMGNSLDNATLEDIEYDNLKTFIQKESSAGIRDKGSQLRPLKRYFFGVLRFLSRMRPFKRTLLRAYSFLFEYYANEK